MEEKYSSKAAHAKLEEMQAKLADYKAAPPEPAQQGATEESEKKTKCQRCDGTGEICNTCGESEPACGCDDDDADICQCPDCKGTGK